MIQIPPQRPYVKIYLDEIKDPALLGYQLLRLMASRARELQKAIAGRDAA